MVPAQVSAVAVVGAEGFLGAAIVRDLSEHHQVHSFTRAHPLVTAGRLDQDAKDAETIVWAASSVNPATADRNMAGSHDDSIAFEVALSVLRLEAPEARVILLSSGGTVYGPPSAPPFMESERVHPVNGYGHLKAQMERMLLSHGHPGTILRISNAYGPGQRAVQGQGVIAHWLAAIREGKPIRVFGSPSTTRDYVYIDDVVRAVAIAHETKQIPRVLNIGSGVGTPLADVLDVVLSVTGDPGMRVVFEEARAIDTRRSHLSIERARWTMRWSPVVPLREGVRRTWEAQQ